MIAIKASESPAAGLMFLRVDDVVFVACGLAGPVLPAGRWKGWSGSPDVRPSRSSFQLNHPAIPSRRSYSRMVYIGCQLPERGMIFTYLCQVRSCQNHICANLHDLSRPSASRRAPDVSLNEGILDGSSHHASAWVLQQHGLRL
jgi:hypothetical protein